MNDDQLSSFYDRPFQFDLDERETDGPMIGTTVDSKARHGGNAETATSQWSPPTKVNVSQKPRTVPKLRVPMEVILL